MRIEWSAAAIADLARFAVFLQDRHPNLASRIAGELIARAQVLLVYPRLAPPDPRQPEIRQLTVRALNASYILRYRLEGQRVIVQRVFHSREKRAE